MKSIFLRDYEDGNSKLQSYIIVFKMKSVEN